MDWSTASQINNQFFIVEKSVDGKNWNDIGKINGEGTSFGLKKYSFTDTPPNDNSYSYYRLKQVDFDGTFSHSEIIASECFKNKTNYFSIYPNPSDGVFYFKNLDSKDLSEIKVFDSLGKIVFEIKANGNTTKLDLSHCSKGVYIVTINGSSGNEFFKLILL